MLLSVKVLGSTSNTEKNLDICAATNNDVTKYLTKWEKIHNIVTEKSKICFYKAFPPIMTKMKWIYLIKTLENTCQNIKYN